MRTRRWWVWATILVAGVTCLPGCLITHSYIGSIPTEDRLEFASADGIGGWAHRVRFEDGIELLVVDGLLEPSSRRVVFTTDGRTRSVRTNPDGSRPTVRAIEVDPATWSLPTESEKVTIGTWSSSDDSEPAGRAHYLLRLAGHRVELLGSDWAVEEPVRVDLDLRWTQRSPLDVTVRWLLLPVTVVTDVLTLPIQAIFLFGMWQAYG